MKNSLSLLEEKFNKFYNQELPLLKKRQTILQKELNNRSLTASINATIAKLYDAPPPSKDIIVYILPSSKNHTGGTGGTIDGKSINLVNEKYPNDSDAVNLIKEAAVSSLFPNGALGRKLLNSKGVMLNTKIPKEYTKELIKLANMYTKKNRSFDSKYIEKVYSLVSELIRL